MNEIFLSIILYTYNTIGLQNLGLAIIEISILTRVVFYPFLKQQAQYSKKMAELAPHISALKEKHRENKQAMAAAQMELFKQHGVNPAAGCLPAVIQIVVLFGLLGAMNIILTMKLNTAFWIWDMAKPDAYHVAGIPFAIPGLLVILAAATQFIQTKMMMPQAPSANQVNKINKVNEGNKETKKEFMEEFAEAQGSMMWMFPLMFLFLGTQWPSGLAMYWTVSSVLAIWQQYRVTGLGGLEPYVVKLRSYGQGKKS